MKQRIEYQKASPEAFRAMLGLEKCVNESGLEKSLLELVKMRVSQINGCAYCIDMHSKDARHLGESEQRLYLLNAWRETSHFSERESAALGWAETLTLISTKEVSDSLFDRVSKQFSDKELVILTTAINAINAWNRLAISFRTPAGTYEPS